VNEYATLQALCQARIGFFQMEVLTMKQWHRNFKAAALSAVMETPGRATSR
jgi:hypothetical protein